MEKLKKIPKHIGIIPDGNRRWAERNGFKKKDGYRYGISPGIQLYDLCVELGVEELTFYGFTKDNTKRPADQTKEFQKACVDAVTELANKDAELLIVGDTESELFPKELLKFTKRTCFGKKSIKINFLVNYGWNWDLNHAQNNHGESNQIIKYIASSEISRIDLIIRWGGRYRLSGFLPVQSIYSDVFVVDEMWPDFQKEQFYRALQWYQVQDVTLGG